jgi:hypothetical protein
VQHEEQHQEQQHQEEVLGGSQLAVSLVGYLGLLLTFGGAFPPLAVAIGGTMLAVAWWTKVGVGRFLCAAETETGTGTAVTETGAAVTGAAGAAIATEAVEADTATRAVVTMEEGNQDCGGRYRYGYGYWYWSQAVEWELRERQTVAAMGGGVYWMLLTVSCWFYALFLFDTLGDDVGFARACWVLLAVSLLPLILYVLYSVCYVYLGGQRGFCRGGRAHDAMHCLDDRVTPTSHVELSEFRNEVADTARFSHEMFNVLQQRSQLF